MILPFIYTKQEAEKVANRISSRQQILCLSFKAEHINGQFLTREQRETPQCWVILADIGNYHWRLLAP